MQIGQTATEQFKSHLHVMMVPTGIPGTYF